MVVVFLPYRNHTGEKMLVQKEFLSKLKDFGLNSYESKLWTALLSRGVSTAGELSDIANVPRSRSYDVLESLEKKGFIVMKLGKPIKYVAVPPEDVIERVKKKVRENTEKQLGIIDGLTKSKVLTELNSLHSQGIVLVDPLDMTGLLKGRENIYRHLASVIKRSKKSVFLSTTSDGLKRKLDLVKHLENAKQRGVKVKIAVPPADPDVTKAFSKVAELKDLDLKSRFCILDNKELVFMLMDDTKVHESYDAAVWVGSDSFASALGNAFNSEWEK